MELCKDQYMYPKISAEDQKYEYSSEKLMLHDSAYDSYVTGVVFLKLLAYTKRLQKSEKLSLSDVSDSHKISISESDMKFLNLAGDDIVPERENLFMVNLETAVSADEVELEFPKDKFGEYRIKWINDNMLYIEAKRENIEQFKELCSESSNKRVKFEFSIKPFTVYYENCKKRKNGKNPS